MVKAKVIPVSYRGLADSAMIGDSGVADVNVNNMGAVDWFCIRMEMIVLVVVDQVLQL